MKTKARNLLVLTILMLACLIPVTSVNAAGSSEETRQVIIALFEAFNRHDTDALVALYFEDARIRSPGDIEARIGKEVVREIYDNHFDNIPGVQDTVYNVIAEGERGSVEFIASWDKPTADDPNARESLRIASFLTIRNGKIIEDITYFDRVEMAEKMTIREPL